MTAKLYGFDRSFLHDTTERDPFVIDMVRAEDYLRVEAQVAELQEQVRALAAEGDRMKKSIKRIFPEGVGDEKGGIGFSDTAKECYASATETPATNAVVCEIQAQAVEGFGMFHNFSDRRFIQTEAKKYAALIRAGAQP